jgi:hypothetical protein
MGGRGLTVRLSPGSLVGELVEGFTTNGLTGNVLKLNYGFQYGRGLSNFLKGTRSVPYMLLHYVRSQPKGDKLWEIRSLQWSGSTFQG